MSAILGGAELARLEVPDDSPAVADLDDVRYAATRAAELTRQLMTFSRKQTRRPRVQGLRDCVRHGADAQLAWREHGGAIDLVVTDLRMPDMGGHALVAWLRAERPTLPIAVMSAYTSGPDEQEAALTRREIFLEKPFTAESPLVHVRDALDGRMPAS